MGWNRPQSKGAVLEPKWLLGSLSLSLSLLCFGVKPSCARGHLPCQAAPAGVRATGSLSLRSPYAVLGEKRGWCETLLEDAEDCNQKVV